MTEILPHSTQFPTLVWVHGEMCGMHNHLTKETGSLKSQHGSLLVSGLDQSLHYTCWGALDSPWASSWCRILRWEASVPCGLMSVTHSLPDVTDLSLSLPYLPLTLAWASIPPASAAAHSPVASPLLFASFPSPFPAGNPAAETPPGNLGCLGKGNARLFLQPSPHVSLIALISLWPPPDNCGGLCSGIPGESQAHVHSSSKSLLTWHMFPLCLEEFWHRTHFLPFPPLSPLAECLTLQVVGLVLFLSSGHTFIFSCSSKSHNLAVIKGYLLCTYQELWLKDPVFKNLLSLSSKTGFDMLKQFYKSTFNKT